MLIEKGVLVGYDKKGRPIYKCPFCGAQVYKSKFFYLDFGKCKHVVGLDAPDGSILFSDDPQRARDLLLTLEEI